MTEEKWDENCECCDKSKFKIGSFKKNDPKIKMANPPYWRVYCDGYGGQKSMGVPSFEGAIGGFVFVCSSAGTIRTKLYASTMQFPAILFQFLQDVEREHFKCREIVVDTHSVNLSQEAEEVSELFLTKIIPISAGTPQELAYAESGVRTIAKISRSMLLGAPHLPAYCWGLSDIYAAYVHDILPQRSRGDRSPREIRTGIKIHPNDLFVKVFGAPCRYAPMGGAEHKRGELTLEGFFVGMQWPMVIVMDKASKEMMSVSRKKVTVYEEGYTIHHLPSFPTTIYPSNDSPHHVRKSINVLGKHKIPDKLAHPPPNTTATPLTQSAEAYNHPHQGEGMHVPEHVGIDGDGKVDEEQLTMVGKWHNAPTSHKAIAERLKRGRLARGKKVDRSKVTSKNVVGQRKRKKRNGDYIPGERVRIQSTAFDGDVPGSYSRGKPEWVGGKVVESHGGIHKVLWDGDRDTFTHYTPLERIPDKFCSSSVMAALEVGATTTTGPADLQSSWPKDFYEALVRSDWREWVAAVKKENEGWLDNDAAEEVTYSSMARGASLIPLGERFTIKRDGTHKFRQYAMGNLLKEGKDYGDTFATTVSADGLRWFCSLACSVGKEVRGWDATTGYLQSKQRIPVYAYVPSHHHFSMLSYEELAVFRQKLIEMVAKEGVVGLRRFSGKMKRESRQFPRVILLLKSSVYGIPDGGQAFAMLMQSVHIKKCGMTQCEMDPSIYVRIDYDDDDKVRNYIIAITWTDDVRYFGTTKAVDRYESTVQKEIKCKLEGVSKEFVSIEMNHDTAKGTMELTQRDYWVKAVTRFKDFLPEKGPAFRAVPVSVSEFAVIDDPASDKEVEEAKHLPYPQLLGVIQYPSAFTKLEMRYAVSILSRHRGKWAVRHFKALLKALEYGYHSRQMGLLYTRPNTAKDTNVLTSYADSGFSSPRSQGCRCIMLNGAAISFTSKRHTTTDDSTTAAELTEQYLCACDAEGLRNLMAEVGLHQERPTIIYQDNQPAIHISMNRGALSKKTRAMDMRVLTVRNKIEDGKVIPIFLKTSLMVADIGTKALDRSTFEFLRDLLCGYATRSNEKEAVTMMIKFNERWKHYKDRR